jgi:hypothetical protein
MSNWPELFSLLNRNDPIGFVNAGEHHDSEDQYFESSSDDTLAGSRVWIAYNDGSGVRSERWVKISRIETQQDADYMFGHCELRNAKRSFRIDRIIEIADSYGELHDPRNFFDPFINAPHGRAAGTTRNSAVGRAIKILNLVGQELVVLAFAAECDGKFVPREASLITSYAKLRCEDLGLVITDEDGAVLRKWLKLQKPDSSALKIAIHNIANKNDTTAEELIELTDLVFEADTKIKPEEKSAAKLFKELITLEFAMVAGSGNKN